MKDQHTKITGYRDLNQQEIDMMNQAKKLGNEIGVFLEEMNQYIDVKDGEVTVDPRWLNIAKTHIETGFMFLVKSVAKPTTFA